MTEYFKIFGTALSGFYALIPSFGLAIILLTILVRVILLPLSIKQTKSMREMQRIQPEIKKLQAKNKGDRQKMNEELMALYKEHGVNPLGGCAPLLLQFPVLIGLFYVIRDPEKYVSAATSLFKDLVSQPLATHQFLGLRLDCSSSAALSGADPSNVGQVCGDGVISALPYLVLVLLMGFTTYYQQKQMQASRGTGDPQQQQMQMIMRIMPLMLMFFAFTFPTGVVIYWLTTNVWTIAQQRVMIHGLPSFLGGSPKADEPPPKGAAAKGGNSKKELAKPVTPKKELPKKKTSSGGKTSGAARQSGNKKKKR
jgi:YidC/Oxa1 family membrane protein insertase